MKSKQFKTMLDGEKEYRFSYEKFREKVRDYAKSNKTNIQKVLNTVAEKTYLSCEAIKKWYKGDNGPGDISYVRETAEVLCCDYHELLDLYEREEKQEMDNIKKVKPEVVSGLFSKCVKLLYKLKNKDLKPNEDFEKLHMYVDQISFEFDSDAVEKFHEFVDEFKMICDFDDSEYNDWKFEDYFPLYDEECYGAVMHDAIYLGRDFMLDLYEEAYIELEINYAEKHQKPYREIQYNYEKEDEEHPYVYEYYDTDDKKYYLVPCVLDDLGGDICENKDENPATILLEAMINMTRNRLTRLLEDVE